MAVGSRLQTISRTSVSSTEGMSGETIAFAAALDAVADRRPEDRRRGRAGADRSAHAPEAHRQRELREPGHAVGHGQLAERQVRRGCARSSPLRRLRQRRHDRVPRRRARVRACSAPITRTRSPTAGSTPTSSPSGPCSRNGWSRRRSNGSRPAHVNDLSDDDWETLREQLVNQTLLGMSLQAGGHLTHGFRPNISGKLFRHRSYGVDPTTFLTRLRRRAAARARGTAADPDRGLQLLPAPRELPRDARDRRRGRRDVHGRHGALRRARRRQSAHRRLRSGAARAHRHHHDAQDVARAHAAGSCCARRSSRSSSTAGCPLVLGGPLPHVMAAKAVALDRSVATVVPRLRGVGDRQRRARSRMRSLLVVSRS